MQIVKEKIYMVNEDTVNDFLEKAEQQGFKVSENLTYIYPNKFLLTMSTQTYLEKVKHEYTELKIQTFKPKVIL